jgi:hypothetical protein
MKQADRYIVKPNPTNSDICNFNYLHNGKVYIYKCINLDFKHIYIYTYSFVFLRMYQQLCFPLGVARFSVRF